jgi:hypothetical protein
MDEGTSHLSDETQDPENENNYKYDFDECKAIRPIYDNKTRDSLTGLG